MERLKDIASEANQTIEDAWKERIIGFRLSRDSDKYSIEVGEGVTRVTPFIKISMNALTPILIPSVKGELVVNPGYQSSLELFCLNYRMHFYLNTMEMDNWYDQISYL